jgi:hypothetical protein
VLRKLLQQENSRAQTAAACVAAGAIQPLQLLLLGGARWAAGAQAAARAATPLVSWCMP